MSALVLILCLVFAFLAGRLYTRATSGMSPVQLTILDVILLVIVALFLFWGFPRVTVERSAVSAAAERSV